jgi:hypothetical protein
MLESVPHWKRPLLRPPIGSQVKRANDPRIAVVISVTEGENVLRYSDDSIETFNKEEPFEYVGMSDPANWHEVVRVVSVLGMGLNAIAPGVGNLATGILGGIGKSSPQQTPGPVDPSFEG